MGTPEARAAEIAAVDAIAAEYLPCRCEGMRKYPDYGHSPNCNVYQRVALADALLAFGTEMADQRAEEIAQWCDLHGKVTANETAMLTLDAAAGFARSTKATP